MQYGNISLAVSSSDPDTPLTPYSTNLKTIGLVTLKPVTCIYMYIGFNATTPLASDFVVPAICGKDRVNRKNKNHVIEEEAKGL